MKSSINKILVPVDFSNTSNWALIQAAKMAVKINAKLVLLHVISPATIDYPENIGIYKNNDLNIKKHIRSKLKQIQNNINNVYRIKPNIFVKSGFIAQSISNFSLLRKVDLIFMGTHGVNGIKEIFIGSNVQKVIAISKIPVLAIRSKKSLSSFKTILVPIDDSLHSRAKVNLAVQIAELYNSKIHILGIIDTPRGKKQLLHKLTSVEKLLKSKAINFQVKILAKQNLAKVALQYGIINKCSLIVINAGHESKLNSSFLNFIEQHLVNHSPIPIITIKPKRGNFSNTV